MTETNNPQRVEQARQKREQMELNGYPEPAIFFDDEIHVVEGPGTPQPESTGNMVYGNTGIKTL